ncbi:enabled [Microdochium nivale]|nr:enabled [Microdochium nivale]
MDEQFNGRTDDDLFADDFEPAEPRSVEQPAATPPRRPRSPSQPRGPKDFKDGLSQSRHATPAKPRPPRNRKTSPKPTGAPPKNNKQSKAAAVKPAAAVPEPAAATPSQSTEGPAQPDAAPAPATPTSVNNASGAKGTPHKGGSNTAHADRLGSGQNPRTKLSDKELADKMERMRLAAIERTRKFEQAEKDSQSHAAAYEKGMEDQRKRRAEEAEKRKRGEEERRRMDDERERNRERKMRAMSAKTPGTNWDDGKETRMADEDVAHDRRRGGFRGAHGGVRGRGVVDLAAVASLSAKGQITHPRSCLRQTTPAAGLAEDAAVAAAAIVAIVEEIAETVAAAEAAVKPPSANDFPALPVSEKPAAATKPEAPKIEVPDRKDFPSLSSVEPASPPVGRWDEEMEYMDAAAAAKESAST